MFRGSSLSRVLSLWRISATVLVSLCVMYVSIVPIGGNDFWLQAKIGELIVQEHAIPATLLFPFTSISTAKFNAHEWLASVAFHLILNALGEELLPLVIGILGLLLFALMSRLAYFRGNNNYGVALFCGAISIVAENYRHELRPELLSLLLMASFWNLLESFRHKLGALRALLIMVVMVFWVNCHGSFVLGPIMTFLYAFGHYLDFSRNTSAELVRTDLVGNGLAILTIGVSACCLVNPYGWELVRFVFVFSGSVDSPVHLTEWIPTLDHRLYSLRGFWFAAAVWVSLTGVMIANIRRAAAIDILIYIAFSLLAIEAIRFPVYLGMVFAYVAPPYLASRITTPAQLIRSLQAMCILTLAVIYAATVYGNVSRRRPYYYDDPTEFTQRMRKAISNPAVVGNVLNSMELGAELTYRAYPRLRPAIDSRFDSYGTSYVNYINSLIKDDDLFEAFISKYDVRYVLIDGGKYTEFIKLRSWREGRWRVYCMDHKAIMFQRADIFAEDRPIH